MHDYRVVPDGKPARVQGVGERAIVVSACHGVQRDHGAVNSGFGLPQGAARRCGSIRKDDPKAKRLLSLVPWRGSIVPAGTVVPLTDATDAWAEAGAVIVRADTSSS